MTDERPFLDALREELLAAAARQVEAGHAIRPRPRILIAVVRLTTIVAVLVSGLVIVSFAAPAEADVRVEVEGSRVAITLVDLEHRPERIEAATRAAGLDVTVTAVPVGPSLVGRFVRTSSDGGPPPQLRRTGAGPTGSSFAGFTLPMNWPGKLQLDVGRPARSGERYEIPSDAFALGEPLGCADLLGAPAVRTIEALAALELTAIFDVRADDGPVERLNAGALRQRGLLTWVVRGGRAVSPERVVIDLAPPGAELPPSSTVQPC